MKFTLRPQRRLAARSGPGISLFPFLAVLICTMGALVPLLLAMMHTARVQAEAAAVAKAREAAAKHSAELQTRREDVQWRIEQLKSSRKQTQSQLADARLDLGHLEDHSRRLRAELERYQNTVAELENIENTDRQKNGQLEAELQQLHQQIDTARQQVDQARKEAASRPRSFAVVPYEGPNQTRRRPIYLECLADAVVIQPEGIRLTTADFEGPMGPGNPLAAALRAAREQLLAERQFDPQAGEPYPLLLVRPEGIAAYYIAREAMKLWGCDFGYELVGDDWKLAYPPPNPRLVGVISEAIASARINQERLIAAAPREYPSHRKATYRASPQGGFARDDGGSDDDDGGYRPAVPGGPVGRNGGVYGGGANGGYGAPGSGSGGGYGGTGTQAGGLYNPYAALPEHPGMAGSGSGGTGGPAGQYNPYTTVPGQAGTGVAGIGGAGAPSGGVASNAGPMLASPNGNNVGGGGVAGGGVGGSGVGGSGVGGSGVGGSGVGGSGVGGSGVGGGGVGGGGIAGGGGVGGGVGGVSGGVAGGVGGGGIAGGGGVGGVSGGVAGGVGGGGIAGGGVGGVSGGVAGGTGNGYGGTGNGYGGTGNGYGGTGNGNAGGMSPNGGARGSKPDTRQCRRRDRAESLCHHAAISRRLGPRQRRRSWRPIRFLWVFFGRFMFNAGPAFQRFAEQWRDHRAARWLRRRPACSRGPSADNSQYRAVYRAVVGEGGGTSSAAGRVGADARASAEGR